MLALDMPLKFQHRISACCETSTDFFFQLAETGRISLCDCLRHSLWSGLSVTQPFRFNILLPLSVHLVCLTFQLWSSDLVATKWSNFCFELDYITVLHAIEDHTLFISPPY